MAFYFLGCPYDYVSILLFHFIVNNYSIFLFSFQNQVYALLQVKNARADEDHISRLERALSQAKSENATLTEKLKSAGSQTVSCPPY